MKKYYATATGLYSEEDWGGPPPHPYEVVYMAKEVDEWATVKNIEILRGYMIAGRDMHDTVKRFIERRDAKAPIGVIEMYVHQMRVDLKKWPEVSQFDEYPQSPQMSMGHGQS